MIMNAIIGFGLLSPFLIWLILSLNKQVETLQEDNRILRMEAEAEQMVFARDYKKEKNND